MSGAVLTSTDPPVLIILTGENCRNAIRRAFEHALSAAKCLRVVQILSSDLYHYGRHDLVATRPSKRQFLLYIRNEVLKRGQAEVRDLEETASRTGISLEIQVLESDDFFPAVLSEVKKGCDVVFLPKQRKRLFPLFKPTLEEYLRKRVPGGKIIPC